MLYNDNDANDNDHIVIPNFTPRTINIVSHVAVTKLMSHNYVGLMMQSTRRLRPIRYNVDVSRVWF